MSGIPKERLDVLIHKYLEDSLTDAEYAELREFATVYPQIWQVIRRLQEDELLAGDPPPGEIDLEKALEEVRARAARPENQWPAVMVADKSQRKRARLVIMTWTGRAVSAALVIGVVVIGLIRTGVLHGSRPVTNATVREAASSETFVQKNIVSGNHTGKPGGYKATLTLANGQSISLDSSTVAYPVPGEKEPSIWEIGSLSYVPIGGTVVRQSETIPPDAYHKMNTPRGGIFNVILPDGSRVWLNCASSLRYPVHFNGNSRGVQLTGEAYFDVVTDPSKPFTVYLDKQEVKALGTRFTVTAYDPEVFQTVLLEGNVRVKGGKRESPLTPGQELSISKAGKWKIQQVENPERVNAFTRGLFDFRNMPLSEILKRLSLWYDVGLDMKKMTVDPLRAITVSVNKPLSDILRSLENNSVHLLLKENTIIASN